MIDAPVAGDCCQRREMGFVHAEGWCSLLSGGLNHHAGGAEGDGPPVEDLPGVTRRAFELVLREPRYPQFDKEVDCRLIWDNESGAPSGTLFRYPLQVPSSGTLFRYIPSSHTLFWAL